VSLLLSIITVSFNSENSIKKTIDSVRKQDYKNYEHIIIDGNSTDGTQKIIKDYANSSKCKILIEDDSGIYDAMNKGIAISNGDILVFLHSDDVFCNEKTLSRIVDSFSLYKSADIIYGNIYYVNSENIVRYWKSSKFKFNKVRFGWAPPHTAFICRKTVYEKFNFDLKYKISSDYDFMIRVLKSGIFKAVYCDLDIVKMTVGGASNKFSNTLNRIIEDNKIINNNGLFPLVANLTKIFNTSIF
jgi:glycosyltransferase